jgi:hypothetical protein
VMEGLCLLLKKAQLDGDITGVKISRTQKILNILFVDDVLIMTKSCLREWKAIESILSIFFHVSGLCINPLKSTFHYSSLSEVDLLSLNAIFPYKFVDISEGFRYLGFFLKPTDYRFVDWLWILHKYEKRIGLWCYRWLSLGGRYILVKSVLESLPVYWLTVAIIPTTVLSRIRQLMFNFLWSRRGTKDQIHLCKWSLFPNQNHKVVGG